MNNANKERELAESYGAKSKPDSRRGPDWCSFELYGWEIWSCVLHGKTPDNHGSYEYVGWQVARIKNNRYCDHSPQDTLKDALEFACQYQRGEVY